MATKSLALIAIEEHRMPNLEGTELRKDVAAAARVDVGKPGCFAIFDENPEENSDLLLFWIMTQRRRQIKSH